MALTLEICRTNNWLANNNFTPEQEASIYDEQLEDLILNTRWYLDNLHYLLTYRVSWKDYRSKTPTIPSKFVKRRKGL